MAKEVKAQLLGTKDVADMLKVEPKFLRQVLRSTPKYKGNSSARYEWKPDDPFLKQLPKIVADYKTEHDRKAKAKAEKVAPKPAAKKKGLPPKKGKAAKKPKKEPPITETNDVPEDDFEEAEATDEI